MTNLMDVKKIGTTIKMLRSAQGLSLKKLSDLSGVDYSNLLFIEAGKDRRGKDRKNIHTQTLYKIATTFGVSTNDLYHNDAHRTHDNHTTSEHSKTDTVKYSSRISSVHDSGQDWGKELSPVFTRKVPVLNRIPAGDVVDFTDQDFPVRYAEEYVMANIKDQSAYALVVTGDSMVPTLNEGDYVIVSPSTELHNNSIVVFRLKSGNAGVKRFRQVSTTVYLEPDNKDFTDIDGLNNRKYNIKEFVFIHKVVGVYKKV